MTLLLPYREDELADIAALVRRLAKRPGAVALWIVTRGVRECASDAALRQSSQHHTQIQMPPFGVSWHL